jgi:hypothetical protein
MTESATPDIYAAAAVLQSADASAPSRQAAYGALLACASEAQPGRLRIVAAPLLVSASKHATPEQAAQAAAILARIVEQPLAEAATAVVRRAVDWGMLLVRRTLRKRDTSKLCADGPSSQNFKLEGWTRSQRRV